jgi:hypothetical protein
MTDTDGSSTCTSLEPSDLLVPSRMRSLALLLTVADVGKDHHAELGVVASAAARRTLEPRKDAASREARIVAERLGGERGGRGRGRGRGRGHLVRGGGGAYVYVDYDEAEYHDTRGGRGGRGRGMTRDRARRARKGGELYSSEDDDTVEMHARWGGAPCRGRGRGRGRGHDDPTPRGGWRE